MKKLILTGLACFVLGVLVGCLVSPNRWKISSSGGVCFKIDTLTGKTWRYYCSENAKNVGGCKFYYCSTN